MTQPMLSEAVRGLTVSALICFAIPVFGFFWTLIKYKKTIKPFIFGALAFIVSQMLLRIPMIQFAQANWGWFTALQTSQPFIYCLMLGLTAGLFEETARYISVRFLLRDKRGYGDALAFGFGHGGCEAVAITGISIIKTLAMAVALEVGSFDSLMSAYSPEAREAIASTLYNISFISGAMGGVERFLAVTAHIGMTVIIFRGFARGKPGIALAAAIGVHTLGDTVSAYMSTLGINVMIIELFVSLWAALLLAYTLWAKRRTNWDHAEKL